MVMSEAILRLKIKVVGNSKNDRTIWVFGHQTIQELLANLKLNSGNINNLHRFEITISFFYYIYQFSINPLN